MNRVPDPNDSATLEKLKLDRSQIDDAITVNATGKRFFWVFEYPQFGIVTANELVFPASKAVRINLRTEGVYTQLLVAQTCRQNGFDARSGKLSMVHCRQGKDIGR